MQRFHELSSNELAALDIAEVNLECATGLHGSENLDIPAALSRLNEWTDIVRLAAMRHWPRFERNPAEFENSIPYFCMLVMVTVLQRDLGVRYNLDSWERPYDGTDSRLHFIHGILDGYGGSCESMPVLYVAVGRRLGYPLKIVAVQRHLIARWDDPDTGTRFNIESTCQGLRCEPDEYYLKWPEPVPPGSVEEGWMLQSMTATEELALFYKIRGLCFQDWCNYRNMLEMAYHASHLLSEANPNYRHYHVLATLLCRQYIVRDMQYGIHKKTGEIIALEHGRQRETHPFEADCVRYADNDFARLKVIHQARREREIDRAAEDAFATLSVDPGCLTRETFHTEEFVSCTTQR